MNTLAVIPARYASSRFPGKPLALVKGVPMIVRVLRQAQLVFDNVCVATDDKRIITTVAESGGCALLTSEAHPNGTSRCLEALEKYSEKVGKVFDAVINVQGDEPFIRPDHLRAVADCFKDNSVEIATIVKHCTSLDEAKDPNRPKVVTDKNMNALYFSRATIPFCRDEVASPASNIEKYYLHVGLYGYRTDILRAICSLGEGELERIEKLEQLRWIENGYKIKVVVCDGKSWSVDTPADLDYINSQDINDLLSNN